MSCVQTDRTCVYVGEPCDRGLDSIEWSALPVALADTVAPDIPLANESVNLTFPGNDL